MICQDLQDWFNNGASNGKPKAAPRRPEGLGRRWNWKDVLVKEMGDEIKAVACKMSGDKAGSQAFLAVWKAAIEVVASAISEDELADFEAKAKVYTEQKPPAEIQAKSVMQPLYSSLPILRFHSRAAARKGRKMVEQFAKKIHHEAGMRIFVLGAYKDEDGQTVMEE